MECTRALPIDNKDVHVTLFIDYLVSHWEKLQDSESDKPVSVYLLVCFVVVKSREEIVDSGLHLVKYKPPSCKPSQKPEEDTAEQVNESSDCTENIVYVLGTPIDPKFSPFSRATGLEKRPQYDCYDNKSETWHSSWPECSRIHEIFWNELNRSCFVLVV
jgi:hypothetical protein